MQYLPAIASAGSSITCGIYTVAIPAGSSSSTSDDISLTASFDASVAQSLYSLHMTLTAVAAVNASALTFSNPFPTAQCAGGYDTPGEDTYAQTVFFQPLQSASPGTYNIVFAVTDGTNTATATVQLTIAATSDATIPPAITNGQYSAWVYPNALTVAPSSTISAQAGVYYQTLPPLPLTASWSGLPEGVLVSPAPKVTYNNYEFTLWASDNTTDGTYTVTFTLTWSAVDYEPAPANESWTASFSFTLVIDSSYVASTAKYKPPVSGRSYGIVGGASRSGYTLRALAIPVNPRTVKQVAARHKFSSAKLAWLSYGPFGANNPVTEGYTPQEAWLAQNLTYNGVLSTGPSVDGVVGEGTLGPCASAEAYEVMVNVNRANLGLNALDTPTLVDMALSMATYPVTNTEGAMTLALNPQAETGVQTPGLIVVAGWSSSPCPRRPPHSPRAVQRSPPP